MSNTNNRYFLLSPPVHAIISTLKCSYNLTQALPNVVLANFLRCHSFFLITSSLSSNTSMAWKQCMTLSSQIPFPPSDHVIIYTLPILVLLYNQRTYSSISFVQYARGFLYQTSCKLRNKIWFLPILRKSSSHPILRNFYFLFHAIIIIQPSDRCLWITSIIFHLTLKMMRRFLVATSWKTKLKIFNIANDLDKDLLIKQKTGQFFPQGLTHLEFCHRYWLWYMA